MELRGDKFRHKRLDVEMTIAPDVGVQDEGARSHAGAAGDDEHGFRLSTPGRKMKGGQGALEAHVAGSLEACTLPAE